MASEAEMRALEVEKRALKERRACVEAVVEVRCLESTLREAERGTLKKARAADARAMVAKMVKEAKMTIE